MLGVPTARGRGVALAALAAPFIGGGGGVAVAVHAFDHASEVGAERERVAVLGHVHVIVVIFTVGTEVSRRGLAQQLVDMAPETEVAIRARFPNLA